MKTERAAYIRYLLCAPVTLVALTLFGLYFTGRRKWGMDHGPQEYLWALLVGLPMAIGNVTYNLIFATFIFGSFPPVYNAEGKVSLFFTTRIKYLRLQGSNLAEHFASVINDYDPGHFAQDGR
jgi:hypothetical protein